MHPVHVARLLERHGFSEDVVLAGLLHDVLEDAKFDDSVLRADLRSTFGAEFDGVADTESALPDRDRSIHRDVLRRTVLGLVKDVTELKSEGGVERPWRVRKDEQIAHISRLCPDGAGLKAADVLHNCLAILRDVRALGLTALERFNCSVEELLWSYGAVAATLRDRLEGHPLLSEVDDAVFELTEADQQVARGRPSRSPDARSAVSII